MHLWSQGFGVNNLSNKKDACQDPMGDLKVEVYRYPN